MPLVSYGYWDREIWFKSIRLIFGLTTGLDCVIMDNKEFVKKVAELLDQKQRIGLLSDQVDLVWAAVDILSLARLLNKETGDYDTNFGGVLLLSHADSKISAIRAVREATFWGLKESKDLVERIPTKLRGITKEAAEELVLKFKAFGGEAIFCTGQDCETCSHKFICYTNKWNW